LMNIRRSNAIKSSPPFRAMISKMSLFRFRHAQRSESLKRHSAL